MIFATDHTKRSVEDQFDTACELESEPGIFAELERLCGSVGGEIQLTDGIAQLLRREKVFAYRYHGVRYDCGSKLGFLQATVDLGQRHAEVGAEFRQWLRAREEEAVERA